MSAFSIDAGINLFLHGFDRAAQVVDVEIVPNFDQFSSKIHKVFHISTPTLLFHKAPDRKVQWIQIRAIGGSQIFRQKRADFGLQEVDRCFGSMGWSPLLLVDRIGMFLLPGHHSFLEDPFLADFCINFHVFYR